MKSFGLAYWFLRAAGPVRGRSRVLLLARSAHAREPRAFFETRAAGEGKGRTREDWYRPRIQGHQCEGYRTPLPPGRANLSGTVRRHARFSTLARRRRRSIEEDEAKRREEEEEKEGKRKIESIFSAISMCQALVASAKTDCAYHQREEV